MRSALRFRYCPCLSPCRVIIVSYRANMTFLWIHGCDIRATDRPVGRLCAVNRLFWPFLAVLSRFHGRG